MALARALAGRPTLLLLDEPLSALDAKIRVSLRQEIRAIQRKLGITTIYVTHDQEEALSMSDRIVVMNAGVAEQVGDPFEIYNHPATRFVASFVGTLNALHARVVDAENGVVTIDGQPVRLERPVDAPAGATISLALRPETLALGPRPGNDATIRGTVEEVSFLGSVVRARVALGQQIVALDTFNTSAFRPPALGDTVDLSFATADALISAGAELQAS